MEKRLLLVFGLTFLVILISQPLLKKFLPQPPAIPQKQMLNVVPDASTANVAAPVSGRASAVALKQAASESETVVENNFYRITFTNRGAQVKSWILKKFDDDAQNGRLDLVNPAAAQKFGYPLSL